MDWLIDWEIDWLIGPALHWNRTRHKKVKKNKTKTTKNRKHNSVGWFLFKETKYQVQHYLTPTTVNNTWRYSKRYSMYANARQLLRLKAKHRCSRSDGIEALRHTHAPWAQDGLPWNASCLFPPPLIFTSPIPPPSMSSFARHALPFPNHIKKKKYRKL